MTKIQKGENDVVFFWHGRGFFKKKERRIFADCEFCEIVHHSYPLYHTSQLEETTKCCL